MPLPLLSGSTVLLTDENSLPNCSLNHSPITCPLMASASLDLSFGSFTTWKPASSVVNFRIELALVEQRFAADERGSLPFVEADFKAEHLHIHQLLKQRKPFLGFLDNGFQE